MTEPWGKHCHECNQLDFLPVFCYRCEQTFCKNCGPPSCHTCKLVNSSFDNVPSNSTPKDYPFYLCSLKTCKIREKTPIICPVCSRQFCVKHRSGLDHFCQKPEKSVEEQKDHDDQLSEIQKAVKHSKSVQQPTTKKPVVSRRIKKNTATSRKVALMKMKGTAKGKNSICEGERLYLNVDFEKIVKPVFVDKCWSVGRCLDEICGILGVVNRNNEVCIDDKLKISLDGIEFLEFESKIVNELQPGDTVYIL